ncbi:Ig-like domain-containing protein [Clostridium sp. MB40-C1]|uniref:Ig-like domain-containing protein n=1 Tax=Clostridium sp. MB40-C1 TaxID=3070996 RepID=UPI0027DF79AE|nr:Ig-like domain-containing protein [Clostridium sp. MB40-C1]WMJ80780.1 Ig-like domain-containing protein [Clostridium sp. MB40-C1]
MTKQKKVVSVLSTSAISGLVASALMTSQAFAAVDAYTVKVGGDVYQYSKTELMESYLDSTEGTKAPLFEDFQAKLTEAKSVYAYHDDKTGYVTAQSVFDKYLENEKGFNLDQFTESKEAKVVEVPTVKKAVVKDGEIKYEDESNKPEDGEVKVTSISAINLKQVKIEFANKITDSDIKDDIEDEDNYTLEDKDGDEVKDVIKEVKLDDSRKFAILTFRDKTEDKKDNYVIQNQEKYTLTIDEDAVGKEIKEELKFKDLDLPKIEEVEAVGVETIKVKFSEPIMPDNLKDISDEWDKNGKEITPELSKDDFDIDNGDLSIRRVELVNDNTEANIIVTSDFKEGQKVSVKVKSSVKDYAGLAVISETKNITVKEDKKAPEIVGFKNAEADEVTLIFDKDVKFADIDANKIDGNNSDLDKFYHSSDRGGNYAKEVKIDGKEVTIKFEEDSISDGSTNIYIKSDVLESRWEVKNAKLSHKIFRDEDKVAPELVKVEQDEDRNDKIKIRFSEKVKLNGDGSATKTGNYTIKDNKGKEWKIKDIKQDGNSEKEFIITTTKDLDDDLKYTLTVESVEDKAGNAIKKVTKDFKVTDNDSVSKDDIKVTVYSAGTNDQKILVDFDSKMNLSDKEKYSAKDLSKYTLISDNKKDFDDKGAITLDQLYKASIKSAKDGKAVEISIPGKDNGTLKEKQFNLNELKGKLSIQIARVADEKGNITDKTFTIDDIKFSGKGEKGQITFDKDDDCVPQAKTVEDLYFAFDDKVNFDSDDIVVVAAEKGVSKEDVEAKAKEFTKDKDTATDTKSSDGKMIKNLPVAKFKTGLNDGNTDLLMTLDKGLKDKRYDDDDYNHILSYEGKFIERDEKGLSKENGKALDVYVVVVPNDKGITETDNDYDETLVTGATLIKDKIGPAIVNNKNRADDYKYKGQDAYGSVSSLIKDDEAVEYSYNAVDNTGSIVLTFEEDIDPNSVSKSTFELKKDDFKDAKIKKVSVKENKVTLDIENLIDQTKDKNDKDYKIAIEDGHEIMQRGPIKDMSDNEVDGLKLQVGAFDPLEVAKDTNSTLKTFTIGGVNVVALTDVTGSGASQTYASFDADAVKGIAVEKNSAKAKSVVVKVNDTEVVADQLANKVLAENDVITVVVTAEDDSTTTYKVTVKKAEAKDTDSTLKTFTIGGVNVVALTDVTGSGASQTYASFDADAVKGIAVEKNSAKAKSVVVKVNDTEVVADQLANKVLAENDVITVVVTAEDDSTTTYKVTVKKAEAKDTDSTLKTFTIGGVNVVALTDVTGSGASQTYASFDADAVKGIAVEKNSAKAKSVVVKVNDTEVVADQLANKVLAENDVITIVVTAEDDSTTTYKVTVKKA